MEDHYIKHVINVIELFIIYMEILELAQKFVNNNDMSKGAKQTNISNQVGLTKLIEQLLTIKDITVHNYNFVEENKNTKEYIKY